MKQPLVVHERRLVPDSEGAGRHRGAPGLHVEYGPLGCTIETLYANDGAVNATAGAQGGAGGAPSAQHRRGSDGDLEEVDAWGPTVIAPGERMVAQTAGGGGYGPPTERTPRRWRATSPRAGSPRAEQRRSTDGRERQRDRPGAGDRGAGGGAPPLHRAEPAVAAGGGRGHSPVRRRADDLDGQDRRRLPAVPRPGVRRPGHDARRPRAGGLLPRRHRGHGRALAAGDGGRGPGPLRGGRRGHDDDADRGRRGRGRRADPPLRGQRLELRPHRHRRQPLGAAALPGAHRPAEGPGQRLVLPRQRRRVAHRDLPVRPAWPARATWARPAR